jgi:hypothetical protein
VTGDVQKLGSRFKASLRVHETRTGRLLATAIASGDSIDALDDAIPRAAAELSEPIK